METSSKGKCPNCDAGVIAITRRNGRVVVMVKCKCMTHPDDVVVFDLEALVMALDESAEATIYVHKGNTTLH